jgi:hypothetical protein
LTLSRQGAAASIIIQSSPAAPSAAGFWGRACACTLQVSLLNFSTTPEGLEDQLLQVNAGQIEKLTTVQARIALLPGKLRHCGEA